MTTNPVIAALAQLVEIRALFEQHFGTRRCPCTCDIHHLIEQETEEDAIHAATQR